MQSHFYHIQLNIDFNHINFYKDLMTFLGWSSIFETEELAGFTSGKNGDIWFVDAETKEPTNYDAMGMNHLSIRVEKSEDIDTTVTFLQQHSINTLFDTPRHRPEFASQESETYYQIMFKTQDNILFEIVYIGPKE